MHWLPSFSPDRFLAEAVEAHGEVLNFGCGNRKFKDELGVDLSPDTDADFVIGADARLPFEDQRFDLVVSRFVFEHLADIDFALGECARVLKPGGQLLFVVPHCFSQDAFDDPTHCNYFTLSTGQYLVGDAKVHYAKPRFSAVRTHLKLSLVFPRWRVIRWPLNAFFSTLSALFPRFSEQLVKLPFVGGTLVFVCTNGQQPPAA